MPTLHIKKYFQEGDLAHEYNPLLNKVNKNVIPDSNIKLNEITNFVTNKIGINLNNPVNIECQPSYDGTVNLIINDDINPPRIINSRFSKVEDNRYRIINRNQLHQTNLYVEDKIDSQTRLFRNINNIPRFDLLNVGYFGQLKGGNYTFYAKFADNDYNQTDIVAESSQVSIFKGTIIKPSSISGTLQDEKTDKSILLFISNIDTSFSKVYLYYSRETSDINGFRTTEYGMVKVPYEIKESTLLINFNGFEEIINIDEEQLNIKYNLVTAVKTQTQVQNMLFFGNIQGVNINVKDLQNISLFIPVTLTQENSSIGYVRNNYTSQENDSVESVEYYNPLNIYYKLGYWPGEIYRLGIVYIMNDDSLSPVFNLRGCEFIKTEGGFSSNFYSDEIYGKLFDDKNNMNYLPQDSFLYTDYLNNTKGVFKNPELISPYDFDNKKIRPFCYKIEITKEINDKLKSLYGVKGYFIVRQKRIPITLCQGLSVGIDKVSYIPMLKDGDDYFTESFISRNKVLTTDFSSRKITTPLKQTSGLLSVDVCVNPQLQSLFDGSDFVCQKFAEVNNISPSGRLFSYSSYKNFDSILLTNNTDLIFVNSDIPLKYINNNNYATRVGTAEDVKQFGFIENRSLNDSDAVNLVRGVYCPFLGSSMNLFDNSIYNIRIKNYSSIFVREYFNIRFNDNSPFFAISDRYELLPITTGIGDPDSEDYIDSEEEYRNLYEIQGLSNVYRGDCFTNTVTIRLNRNFVDPDVPVNETIVDTNTWTHYRGIGATEAEDWSEINRADLNTVPLGMWVTFKCLSNYNLGLRSEDRTNTDEMAIMGNSRKFFPLSNTSVSVANKLDESWKLNDGYNSTVGKKRNATAMDVPYIKDLFDNRIMFSNVQIDDDFINAYRIFQGLAYKDIDRQYGAIVKLIDWGVNLLCVFENGLALIPINEKALMTTNTGQSIHMYGAGVIQNQVTLITPDYGSIWPESVIRTPTGVYGVDTYAKKIWRFSNSNGFELISDMKIQQFLNENIKLAEKDKYPTIALKNVKSHFNNYKGDVMFTFYNVDEDEIEWNFCYNERLGKWITRYSWTPLCSENINNIFYSLDKRRAELLAFIYDNLNSTAGLNTVPYISNIFTDANLWSTEHNEHEDDGDTHIDFNTLINIVNYNFYDWFKIKLNGIESSYIDNQGNEVLLVFNSKDNEGNIIGENKQIICKLEDNYFYVRKSTLEVGEHLLWNSYISNENRVWEPIKTDTIVSSLISGETFYKFDRTSLTHELWYNFEGEDIEDNDTFKREILKSDIYNGKLWLNKDFLNYDEINLYYFKISISIIPMVHTYNDDGSIKWKEIEVFDEEGNVIGTELIHADLSGSTFKQTVGIILNYKNLDYDRKIEYDKLLLNGFYVHGKAGIFDEIDYTDKDETNEILPTKWYDKQEPFEYEFVVNNLTGLHKIFNDLVIISNNVAPELFTFTILGDVYNFNKRGIHRYKTFGESEWLSGTKTSQDFYMEGAFDPNEPESMDNQNTGTYIKRDLTTREYYLKTNQIAKDIKNPDYGRRRGNMSYKEDSWYTTIEPIRFRSKYRDPSTGEISIDKDFNSTRIRDKFLKVRVRYDGKNLALITALKTLMTVSYS